MLFRLTLTPDAYSLPYTATWVILRHDLYSVMGLKNGSFSVIDVLVRAIMIG